jgi:hypothetical protein
LPTGSLTIGSGLLVGGLSIYVFFRLGQEALGQDGFKPIVSLWFVMYALVPGFFLPLEQEVSRAVAHRRALGDGARPVLRKVAPVAAGITVALVAGVAVRRWSPLRWRLRWLGMRRSIWRAACVQGWRRFARTA